MRAPEFLAALPVIPAERTPPRLPRFAGIPSPIFAALAAIWISSSGAAFSQSPSVRWWENHHADQATAEDVLGLWTFDGDQTIADISPHAHQSILRGATWHADGKFGGCLESSAGYPVVDASHGLHVKRSPVLSPSGSFTAEMWVRTKPDEEFPATMSPVLLDMKYVPVNHTGFIWSLSKAGGDGSRRMTVEIGLGERSEQWSSDDFTLAAGQWRHLAFSYDATGTLAFSVDGAEAGRMTKPAGPMAAAVRDLSIGDRIGSLYRGFPGFIDEVRLTRGVREFRPLRIQAAVKRHAFVRMCNDAILHAELTNLTGAGLPAAKLRTTLPGGSTRMSDLPALGAGATHQLSINIDTSLRPGRYLAELSLDVPGWGGGDVPYRAQTTIPFSITRRPLPHRMPVVMWGINGTENVLKEIPRLKDLGFTHCLGLGIDYAKVWEERDKARPGTPEQLRAGRDLLHQALENDIGIVATVAPARWLRKAAVGQPFLRIDRNGKHYGREDISGLFPRVQEFCHDTGAALGRAYGDCPAFAAALLHTEVRGESQLSFQQQDREAYRKATGHEIPDGVTNKNGVEYSKIKDFPADRVIADDDPLLTYLRWFWQHGDGWNNLNTRLADGFHSQIKRENFWTFYDPAVRVPSISGSGGQVDVLSHWTYSYPDPVRIGLCTDELFEMARAGGRGQDVMKMTQLIWYRSQTAPESSVPEGTPSPWVDQDPDAAYITIAPMHLREAFWWKLARPIKGIMYHGWQSLVETGSPSSYRYTNQNTQHELRRLVKQVLEPLGPTLAQVPDPPADIAFLESFTSQMFARRGTYGWNHSWAGDLYHVLMYAQLQPKVLYEESLAKGGLKGVKVLVMGDCDVLTESTVKTVKAFQQDGGLVIGDRELCPAVNPDHVIERFARTKQASTDRAALLAAAGELRSWLDGRYQRPTESTNPDVVTRRRTFGSTDYLFAVNDHRTFGSYVGGYGRVMEDGLPSTTELRLRRPAGHVYDLVDGRKLTSIAGNGEIRLPLKLGPCEGRVLMVTERPVTAVEVSAAEAVERGGRLEIEILVTDGRQPVNAVIPVHLQVTDPEGAEAEFSGYYGAQNGRLQVILDIAPNDRTGTWEIRARELASGISTTAYFNSK